MKNFRFVSVSLKRRVRYFWNRISLRQKYTAFIVLVVVLGVGIAARSYYLNQVVLTVNDKKITRSQLNREIDSKKRFMVWEKKVQPVTPTPSKKSVGTTVVDDVVIATLIDQYSKANDITISEATLHKHYVKAYHSFGSEDAYLAKIHEIYGIDKQALLLKMKRELLLQRIAQKEYLQEKDVPTYLQKQADITLKL